MFIDIDDDEAIDAALEEQFSRMSDKALAKLARDFGISVTASQVKEERTGVNMADYIESSEVPEARVSDKVVQGMINEVSAVLRGVDERYFPRIVFERAVKQGNAYILFYVAEGEGFDLGVVCGTDGTIQKVIGVLSSKQQIGPVALTSKDRLRVILDSLGYILSRRK